MSHKHRLTNILTLDPYFEKCNNAIVFVCDNAYAKFTSTAIQSIIETSSRNNNYDIIIIYRELFEHVKDMISLSIDKKSNFSLRFYDINPLLNIIDIAKWNRPSRFPLDVCFRLFIPYILTKSKQVLYLDSDVLVRYDISEIFSLDIGDNVIAGVQDQNALYNFGFKYNIDNDKYSFNAYVNKYIGCDAQNYINSGVCLFDIDKILSVDYLSSMDKKATKDYLLWVDQDLINYAFAGKIFHLDPRWNVPPVNAVLGHMLKNVEDKRRQNDFELSAKIYHFSGPKSQLILNHNLYAEWRKVASKTPFEDSIQLLLANLRLEKIQKNIEKMQIEMDLMNNRTLSIKLYKFIKAMMKSSMKYYKNFTR